MVDMLRFPNRSGYLLHPIHQMSAKAAHRPLVNFIVAAMGWRNSPRPYRSADGDRGFLQNGSSSHESRTAR